jgi:hypothetical protein
MSRTPLPTPALVVAVIALVIACAGGALAQPHGHATKAKPLSSGEKRAIKKYVKASVAGLHLHSGATGPAGPAGPAGDRGPVGPSNAIEADRGALGPFNSATQQAVVTNGGLAAGAYQLTAQVNLALTETGPGHGVCHLNAGSDTAHAYFWDMNYNGLIPQVYTFDMSLVHVFSTPGDAVVNCQVNGAHWSSVDAHIIATNVGAASHVPGS